MKIAKYLSSLLPSFGRDQVLEDIRITHAEIKEFTQPSYESAAQLFKSWKFKSKVLEAQIATFGRMVPSAGRENIVGVIAKSWKPILENLDDVKDMVQRTYGEEVGGLGLTYLKANLLQFTECCAFVSKYARKLLVYIYVCETAEYEEGSTKVAESLTPAEMEWIAVNFVSFCTALNIASGNPVQVKKQMADIPDIVVTSENAETLPATIGERKTDPFKMKLIPIVMNPIYHVGMFVAEWQANRYKAAKEEVKLLELRRLNLEKLHAGKPDAHVQKEIAYMEGRIQKLNYQIAKMEAAHG